MVRYIETNNILSKYQAGFRSKNSCESALQSVLFNWKSALQEGKMIGVVFLDFKRAFETINRNLLLLKMEKYGFGPTVVKWFSGYLSGRTQVTKYGNVSSAKETMYGVPQGTVLGPILFILYINDIVKIINKSRIQLFADDTVIYVMDDKIETIIETLNDELKKVCQWLDNNSLQLNTDKTKMMIIKNKYCRANCTGNVDVKINNVVIQKVKQFKYLGCIVDENLLFTDHCKYITNKIAKKINVLGRMSWAKLTVYKTIIAPHFYFCSTLLFLMNNSDIETLQKKQNRALRIILGCNRYTKRVDMLNCTNLLSVRQTITYNTMTFIYKMVNYLLPDHLLSNCTFVKDMHEHNTRSRNNFYLNRVGTNYGQNSLFYKGLKEYNELPDHVKACDSLVSFKSSCISHIKNSICI